MTRIPAFVSFIAAVALTCYLLAPGVWFDDALNEYIPLVTGSVVGGPVLISFLFKLTMIFYPGSLPVFVMCVVLYFAGFALLVFSYIREPLPAVIVFFALSFWPPLFINLGVIQTDSLQLALLAVFIPLTLWFHRYRGEHRAACFIGLIALLCAFYLARFDSIFVALVLAYWLLYTFTRQHSYKAAAAAAGLLLSFNIVASVMQGITNNASGTNGSMRNALMVGDLAAISVDSKINYVPDYCWQNYVSAGEKNINRMDAPAHWERAYFSFLFNVDPSIGIFVLPHDEHTVDITLQWLKAVILHPLLYLKYHLKIFGFFLFDSYFNMTFSGGLRLSEENKAKLMVDSSEAVAMFLKKHGSRFGYRQGVLYLLQDDVPIGKAEEKELVALVGEKRFGHVEWMIWFSQVPRSIYQTTRSVTAKVVGPVLEEARIRLPWLWYLFLYFAGLVVSVFFLRQVKDSYQRFSLAVLCVCGLANLLQRFLIVTDPVYRFGVISILFFFFVVVILLGNKLYPPPHQKEA